LMNVLSLHIFVVIFLCHELVRWKGLGYFTSVGGGRQGGGGGPDCKLKH
jgi:hypothetical protein